MRAAARIVAVAGDHPGRTRLVELRGESPLLPRRTGPAEVHLVAGAAGPLGGDLLELHIEVGAGAALCVRTVAASLALPGRDGAESRMEITARVAAGGTLAWLPEPLIAGAGCRHVAVTTIEVADGARLYWRDELVCGRHGESPGDVVLRTRVRHAGRPLYRQDLAVGPEATGWDGPAVLGAARATGSVLVVDPAWGGAGRPPAAAGGPDAALMPLAGPGVLATAVAADAAGVRAALDRLTAPGSHGGGPASTSGGSDSGGDEGVLAPLLGRVHGRVGGAHQPLGVGD